MTKFLANFAALGAIKSSVQNDTFQNQKQQSKVQAASPIHRNSSRRASASFISYPIFKGILATPPTTMVSQGVINHQVSLNKALIHKLYQTLVPRGVALGGVARILSAMGCQGSCQQSVSYGVHECSSPGQHFHIHRVVCGKGCTVNL